MDTVTEARAETKKLKTKAKASLALLLVAVISITTATYAWFSLSNSTSVQSMIVEVGAGTVLKAYAGVTASNNPADYFAVIKSEGTAGTVKAGESITNALPAGVARLDEVKLWPVSSGNGTDFFTQGTNVVKDAPSVEPEKKYYLELTFTFITDTPMDVYLNGSNSSSAAIDGTLVAPADVNSQADKDAVDALRISFTSPEKTVIYEPGKDILVDTDIKDNAAGGIGLTVKQETFWTLGDNVGRHKGKGDKESPVLFTLVAGIPKVVKVRMWAEGEDAECVNGTTGVNIEKAKLDIRLRFCGADIDGNYIEMPTV